MGYIYILTCLCGLAWMGECGARKVPGGVQGERGEGRERRGCGEMGSRWDV